MKASELKQTVDRAFWDDGKAMTKKFIASLSTKLLHYCEDRAEKENLHWAAVLYRFVYGEPKCRSCGTSNIKFRNFRDGYGEHCSSKCAGANKAVDEKRKKTNMERHGVTRPQQHLPEIRKKFKKTMRKRYGVTYSGQSSILRDKAADTLESRFGKRHTFQIPEVQEKARKTCLVRYGVAHVMQNREHFEAQQRAGFKATACNIGGKVFKLRGSEHHFVQWLVDKGVSAFDIRTTKSEGAPSIPWVDSSGKSHVYHPDAYVKYRGKWYIVEIKSTFTLGLLQHVTGGRSGKYSEVRRKAKACRDAGFRFKLFVIAQEKKKPAYVAAVDKVWEKSKNQVRQELKLLHPGKFRQL